MHNPLVEGWQNSADPHSPIRDGPPSVFGALPFFSSTPLEPPTFLSFTFSDFQPDILNCAVTGPPHSRLYFRVSTDVPTMGFTVVRDAADQPVVIIEWAAPHPIVEVRGIVPKQTTAHWLALSPDKRHRRMQVRGKNFVWIPGSEAISLYAPGVNQAQVFARLTRNQNSVTLSMIPEAVSLGLLEPCVTAALLLQSGRHID